MSAVKNQSNTDQAGGAQLTGKTPSAVRYPVPNVQGRSGQGDNQDTFRKAGK